MNGWLEARACVRRKPRLKNLTNPINQHKPLCSRQATSYSFNLLSNSNLTSLPPRLQSTASPRAETSIFNYYLRLRASLQLPSTPDIVILAHLYFVLCTIFRMDSAKTCGWEKDICIPLLYGPFWWDVWRRKRLLTVSKNNLLNYWYC